jgi:hypothetical protein
MSCSNHAEPLPRVAAPRRNHFFYGKRMDVQHFEMEQSYGKLKQWLMNRLSLGKGVLCGLKVTVDGSRVCIDPGVAIDGLGREIIVPVRTCVDPLKMDDSCCGGHGERPAHRERPREGLFTLWVCYHECFADHEPVLVSDCHTRSQCSPGTIVESFCYKVTPGIAPPLGDPDWCARLWKAKPDPNQPEDGGGETPPDTGEAPDTRLVGAGGSSLTAAESQAIVEAMQSRRRMLCGLFDANCEPGDADPCVPLAVIGVRGDELLVESCLVRPRVFSNAQLLDLILCLADRLDACCDGKHPEPVEMLRVRSVEFIARDGGGETPVAAVNTPLQDTLVPIGGKTNAIRIRFSGPLAQGQHAPTTHGLNDADFARHNVQILPDDPLDGIPFVPGTLTVEAPDTLRFDLERSPYVRNTGGWQKGRYQIVLCGTADASAGRQALADAAGTALDGEAIAPASGVMSGNGTAGGDFRAFFVVAPGETPRETLRVKGVQFVSRRGDAETLVASMTSPMQDTLVSIGGNANAIRIHFSGPLAQDRHAPTTHALNDPDFTRHNVQVLPEVPLDHLDYVPGSIVVEGPDTVRFDLEPRSPYVLGSGGWQKGRFRIVLRGTEDLAANREALADTGGAALDGEAIAPSGGLLSGNGAAGGDFSAFFEVRPVDTPARETLRVRGVEFLTGRGSRERVVGQARSPQDTVLIPKGFDAIRIHFSQPLSHDSAHAPSTPGLSDASFKKHNVQVLLGPDDARNLGLPYLPGEVQMEGPETMRFTVTRESRIVDREGRWPMGTLHLELFLRGTPGGSGQRGPLANPDGDALDGERADPASGFLSGDGSAGGDFRLRFSVERRG